MNRFKIAFFMMAAMICMAATSWGGDGFGGNTEINPSISLNNNNLLMIASNIYDDDGDTIKFVVFEISTDFVGTPSVIPLGMNPIEEKNWGNHSTISLNDKNTFIEANLGEGGKQIYYNAGKIDPDSGEITFTETGLTFGSNLGETPSIHLDNNGNFIEVHEGLGGNRIVKTKTFPFFKVIPVIYLYYVTGKIIDGKIEILNTGKYCGYGETPIITTTDDNIFTEIHAGPDSGSPYSIIGSIDNEGNFLSQSGEGIEAVAGHELKNQSPLAVKMTNIKGTKDYNVTLFTEGAGDLLKGGKAYLHRLSGSLPSDGQITWNEQRDITLYDEIQCAAANDKYFIYLPSGIPEKENALDFTQYKIISYTSPSN